MENLFSRELSQDRTILFEAVEAIFAILELPNAIETAVRSFLKRHWTSMPKISGDAYEGEFPHFNICRRRPLTRLAIVIYLLVERNRVLASSGVDQEIISATFRDVTLRATLYMKQHGKVGLSIKDACWHRHIMQFKLFKIGELQFQDFEMIYLDKEELGEEYMTFTPEQKESLPKGSLVLNVHIQRGANLDAELVKHSFDHAHFFFEKYFTHRDYKAFICCSWLLYPDMDCLLPAYSNIRDFREFFHIIGQANDPESAILDIFGKRYRANKDYPQHTSLQVAALKSMKQLGVAFGIRKFERMISHATYDCQ